MAEHHVDKMTQGKNARVKPEAQSEAESTRRPFRLEDAVQAWLERLPAGTGQASLPPELWHALEQHVLPALEQGEIRAAGPRVRRDW